jgi:aminopeptidase
MTSVKLPADTFDHYLISMLVFGVNLQQGQPLIILANLCDSKTVERIKKLAYSLNSAEVEILYYQYFKKYSDDYLIKKAQSNWAFLKLNMFERFSGDVHQSVLIDQFSIFMKSLSTFSQHSLIQSCSSVIPSITWAKAVFPNLHESEAIQQLGKYLVYAAHCDQEKYLDQCSNHYHALSKRVLQLNEGHIRKLTFKSKTCDLLIGLNEDHVWVGGQQFANGIAYLPNFPTQEAFTANSKYKVNGWLKITRPFHFKGKLISNLKLEIIEGQVIRIFSNQNTEQLEKYLFEKDHRRFIGEIALVDHDNPIAKLELIFQCVLLDENSVCHIALGNAYPVCSLSHQSNIDNDLINISDLHLDLMIGSDDLIISAYNGQQWFSVNQ